MSDSPKTARVRFDCHGVAVGKMRNEMAVTMVEPFREEFTLASDEGAFHGGDATAPPPLALFVAGLTGCIMTQLRAFAKRLRFNLDDLTVDTRVVWRWEETGKTYKTAPRSFEIDIDIVSSESVERIRELVDAAKQGCFIEQTLGRSNKINHRVKVDGEWLLL